jgi:restriction system protein
MGAFKTHGALGFKVAMELLQDMTLQMHRSPWSPFRRKEWKDVTDLDDLFQSESLETPHGSFFDQRFIDYLDRNYSDISSINWRKFEALVCEFFERQGMYVEIGPGRDDDGVDARIWPRRSERGLPPLTIVQCKRERAKVSKVVIKALWADVLAEKAQSGLIVTTSALSPGARRVSQARGYRIIEADRSTVREWIKKLRSPWSGIV